MDTQTKARNVQVPDRAAGLIEAELEAAASETNVSFRLLMGYGFGVLFILGAFVLFVVVTSSSDFFWHETAYQWFIAIFGFSVMFGIGLANVRYTRKYAKALASRGLHPWHHEVT